MKKPDFFIVGAPKCGTTAMSDYLGQHPDIFMAAKELHYFGSDLPLRNRISENEYLAHFRGAGTEKICGEASVWYLFSKKAAKEIKAFSPEAKVLIMLRNPVDVIHSLHSQNIYDGNEDVPDFEAALKLDAERKDGIHLPKSVDFRQLPGYKDATLFSGQVERYLAVFGRENLHVVIYDDFAADTEKEVRKVLRFLGVDAGAGIQFRLINPNKSVRSFYLHRLIKYPPAVLQKIVRFILPARKLRHALMAFLYQQNVTFKKREEMSAELRASLKAFFAEDIRSLGALINRDLSGWLQ